MTDTDERQETAAPPRGPAGRISWRRRLLYLLLAAIGVTVAVHAFGGAHVGITGLSLAGLAVAILVILRLPHLRKHFHNPYKKGGGSGSLNYPGQRGLGLRRPVRGKGSGPGLPRLMRPHRSGSSPASPRRHRSGAGLLSRSRRTGGAGQARSGRRGAGILRGRRSAGTAPRARRGRSPGSGRGGAGSALAGRRAARRTSAGRSRSGRAGSRPFARTGGRRPGGPAAGARRQPSRWNPWARRRAAAAAARRRGAGGGARPGGPGPGRPSRRLPSRWRPVARWRARRRAGSGSGQGRQGQGRQGQGRQGQGRQGQGRQGQGRQGQGRQGQGRQGQGRQGQGRTRPRSIRHPFGGRRFWRTARWPGWRHIGWQLKYGRFMPHRLHRRGWHIIFGTPGNPRLVRRGWHKVFGTPQQRAGRRAARKAHRARIRAARRRRTLHLYGRRTHGRAFWRRQTRRTPRTHAATGQGLNRRQRLARWWHIRRNRLHRGLGIRGTRTRGKRPPRPLLGPVRGNPAMQRFRRSGSGRLDRPAGPAPAGPVDAAAAQERPRPARPPPVRARAARSGLRGPAGHVHR